MRRRFLTGFIIGLGLILLLTYAMAQKWVTPLALALPFTLERTPDRLPSSPAVRDLGTTAYIHTQTKHGELKQLFFAEAKQGAAVSWTFDRFTVEGDPIRHTLVYQPEQKTYQVTIDTTKDKFGSPSITTMTCTRFNELANSLTGCDDGRYFPLQGAPLLEMTKENGLAYLKEFALQQWKEKFLSVAAIDDLPLPGNIQPASDFYTYQLALQQESYTIAINKHTWEEHWFDAAAP